MRSSFLTTITSKKFFPSYSMSSTSSNPTIQGSLSTFVDRVSTLQRWWGKGNHEDSEFSVSLLDLRPNSTFETQQLKHPNLQVSHLPIRSLRDRSYELPARHVEFSILVEPDKLKDLESFFLGPKDPTRKRAGKPWKVTNVLLDTPQLWEEAALLGMVSDINAALSFPRPRLWQPDAMVEKVLLHHLKNRESNGSLQIWDLASGSGRDVAFLAEELLAAGNPYKVWGFDHRYDAKETNITQGFLERRNVGHLTQCTRKDLSSWDQLTRDYPTNSLACLFCVRFWKPDLVTSIAKSANLLSGTLFGISHFCKPFVGASWNFDHPSEKSVLERSQLRDLFATTGWEIVHDEITMDSDHGRTMIHFVVKKV